MKRLARAYGVKDTIVLQSAKVMLSLFEDDQAEFAAFDADFGTPYETTWKQAIEDCGPHLNDETIRDQLQQCTEIVKAAMKACREKYTDLKFFVRKAFPDDPAALQVFGFHTFRQESRKQLALIQLMNVVHSEAEDRAVALNAAGFSNADIAEIDTLNQALIAANTAQEAFKGARGTKTEDRKLAYNALWKIMQTVNRASRSIYRNNPAKKKQYQLPVAPRKKKKEEAVEE